MKTSQHNSIHTKSQKTNRIFPGGWGGCNLSTGWGGVGRGRPGARPQIVNCIETIINKKRDTRRSTWILHDFLFLMQFRIVFLKKLRYSLNLRVSYCHRGGVYSWPGQWSKEWLGRGRSVLYVWVTYRAGQKYFRVTYELPLPSEPGADLLFRR